MELKLRNYIQQNHVKYLFIFNKKDFDLPQLIKMSTNREHVSPYFFKQNVSYMQTVYYQNPTDFFFFFFTITVTRNPYPRLVSRSQI